MTMVNMKMNMIKHEQPSTIFLANNPHYNLARDVIDSRQIDKSLFSLCQLNRIERLGIESQ